MATPEKVLTPGELVLAPVQNRFPIAHCVVCGRSGAGKSRFARTWPKPIRVYHFDAFDKSMQYLQAGASFSDFTTIDISQKQDGSYVVPVRYVFNAKGEIIIEILYFHDDEWAIGEQRYWSDGQWKTEYNVGVPVPVAYPKFLNVMATTTNANAVHYATHVFDSITAMALAARRWGQYKMNPHAKEPRQWFGFATDRLEEMLLGRVAGFPTNVVLVAHIDQDKDELHGEMVYNPSAPGRLAKADGIPSQYGEFYRLYVEREDDGTLVRRLQTQNNGRYNASTQIDAPDGCAPNYLALWSNWKS